jgi:crotonyl-CoA carboxylase/reductase
MPRSSTLYEVGELPPPGVVPQRMYASVIRSDRFGPPAQAFAVEIVDVPEVPPGFVLVAVMAAGVNFNNVWAALGKPIDVIGMRSRQGDNSNLHIGGSEGSGIVWAIGDGVRRVAIGDLVVLSSCRWDEDDPAVRYGTDPMLAPSQQAWGYEANWGSFAQFTLVAEIQCHPKPSRLNWAEAASFMLTGPTAYRQLTGWPPNTLKPGDSVLVWGGSGGLGSMAIQLARQLGGRPIAVVSSPERASYCEALGAVGVIDRSAFDHWGPQPQPGSSAYRTWSAGLRAFGRQIWDILGEQANPAIVFEHPGADTLPTSLFVCAPGGMIVLCGASTGYLAEVDLRILWMRQKRLQGSHYANLRECRTVVDLTARGILNPCLARIYGFNEIGQAHQDMYDGTAPPGNSVALIGATNADVFQGPGE